MRMKEYLRSRIFKALKPFAGTVTDESIEEMKAALLKVVGELEEEEIILPAEPEPEVTKLGGNEMAVLIGDKRSEFSSHIEDENERAAFRAAFWSARYVGEHKAEDETQEKNQKKEEIK